MKQVILGDNQFFGINHMSEEKARAQAIRFQDTSAIIEAIDIAYDEGIKVFMCTTHERVAEICDHVRANPDRYRDFQFYPCMPYAHKYANAVTEKGLVGALKSFLPEENAISALFGGAMSVARKDIEGLAALLIDAEMKMFRGLQIPVIFLQNVVTDLLLGLGMKDALVIFAEHVKRRYQAEPGFITMNAPRLLDVLEECGIDNPIICSNVNKIGFRMSGGLDRYGSDHRQPEVPADCDVGPCVGRDPGGRGHRVCVPPAQDRVDRIRRVKPAKYPPHQAAYRSPCGGCGMTGRGRRAGRGRRRNRFETRNGLQGFEYSGLISVAFVGIILASFLGGSGPA